MGNKPSVELQNDEIKSISEETGFTWTQVERMFARFKILDKSGVGSLSRQNCLAIPELAINPLCDRIVEMFFVNCDADHDRINFRQFMKVLATFRPSSKSSQSSQDVTRSRSSSKSLDELDQQNKNKLLFESMSSSPRSSFTRHFRYFSFHDNSDRICTTNQHNINYALSFNDLTRPNRTADWSIIKAKTRIHQKSDIDLNAETPNSWVRKLHFMFKIYDVNNDNLVDLDDLMAILRMLVGHYLDEHYLNKIASRNLREINKTCTGFIDFDEFCGFASHHFNGDCLKVKFPVVV